MRTIQPPCSGTAASSPPRAVCKSRAPRSAPTRTGIELVCQAQSTDNQVAPASRKALLCNGPPRSRQLWEPGRAQPIRARYQRGFTSRSNLLAQTTVHRIKLGRRLRGESSIVGVRLKEAGTRSSKDGAVGILALCACIPCERYEHIWAWRSESQQAAAVWPQGVGPFLHNTSAYNSGSSRKRGTVSLPECNQTAAGAIPVGTVS